MHLKPCFFFSHLKYNFPMKIMLNIFEQNVFLLRLTFDKRKIIPNLVKTVL